VSLCLGLPYEIFGDINLQSAWHALLCLRCVARVGWKPGFKLYAVGPM